MEEIERALSGDSMAFDEMYRKYYPLVFKMRKKYYLKGFDREDWLQEGRIIFYHSLEKYEAERQISIGNYFKFNFENHIKSLVRKQCAVKRKIDAESISLDQKMDRQGETFFDYMGVENNNALDQMIIREKLEQLPEVLSIFERTTFNNYIVGKDLPEIAKENEVKNGTVRSAFDRAKKKVKDIMFD
ncbi:sigma-70 family RNA polymerase sigma factor [Enterococcus rivorum]|uniref:RNA polymerase subunit sigma-30 n=1 Tax=Enterococcus rivorum TaxID=762845 RepID=A0A1E5KU62_9ENTE|nr:sigma-70 family RNA polymerase sigma factor [Enterococcus rivorum]MBP2098982.1 RNA polymerase sporulation-specific sigma factor [Enterococcus rivorum]OEH81425.1 RNA polymerase subunit sigma-30 [Enterococcus rivorum]